ncbi:hypothetical protein F7734_54070 [Scytonema sp. UIC 10036]|nr:hypothetical protein [Scytonema sp. UIC 10036]MUH00730.1 hypothetical protein [Scytonema sp. UIC 10036]
MIVITTLAASYCDRFDDERRSYRYFGSSGFFIKISEDIDSCVHHYL